MYWLVFVTGPKVQEKTCHGILMHSCYNVIYNVYIAQATLDTPRQLLITSGESRNTT